MALLSLVGGGAHWAGGRTLEEHTFAQLLVAADIPTLEFSDFLFHLSFNVWPFGLSS